MIYHTPKEAGASVPVETIFGMTCRAIVSRRRQME